jgi:hypothetical protein
MNNEIQQAVEQLLMEQGNYTPLELLLAEGRLFYSDYESWRSGELSDLASTLFGDQNECQQLLYEADSYANKRSLIAEKVSYSVWGSTEGKALSFSNNATFNHLFHTRYRQASDIPQLDLFMDSTSTVLINGITQSLIERNQLEARRQLDQLFESDPGNSQLGNLEQLVEATERLTHSVDEPANLLDHLEHVLSPLAIDLLESNSRHFLTPQWHRLTLALEAHTFDAATPKLHSSYSALQAVSWQQVKESVERETEWQQQPILIRRHALACGHLHQEVVATADWFLLCWRFPCQADTIKSEAKPAWQQRWKNFIELEPELPNQTFPAWAIINEPGLLKQLTGLEAAVTEPPEIWRISLALLQDPSQTTNRELMANRKALQKSDPQLFQHYLKRVNRAN